jgi:hypothetical protein
MARTLTTLTTLGLGSVLVLGATTTAAPAAAPAAARAPVTVTIKAEGTDLSGRVRSTKPLKCAADRKVIVFKQKGKRGGGNDIRFASDRTDLQNGKWVWSTGNTGTEGRFYAKVKRKPGCQGDTSRTIRAQR